MRVALTFSTKLRLSSSPNRPNSSHSCRIRMMVKATTKAPPPREPVARVLRYPDHREAPGDVGISPERSGVDSAPTVHGWKRALFLIAAAFFFVLGVLGAVFPVLPATPFLLLTSYFLLRASPALNERLLNSRFFGPILQDWQERGGIRQDVKAKAIVVVFCAVAASIYFSAASPIIITVVSTAALIGVAVIMRLPTL